MHAGVRPWLLLLLLLCAPVCLAQGAEAPPPAAPAAQTTGYPVTGRVICADTQRPARFAEVMLLPAAQGSGDYDRGRMAVGRTDLDGHFSIGNVSPGEYYATAQLTGYVNESQTVRSALSQGGDALNAIAGVPRVQVTAGGSAVQLNLQRGGVISGTVQWDDGSPAAGVQVAVQAPASTTTTSTSASTLGNGFGRGNQFAGLGGGAQTDDRGRYRLTGLLPGSYVLRATVQSPMPSAVGEQGRYQRMVSLSVYAPNKLRRTDATVITLAAGEERPDVNVIMGLSGMHMVSGQVSSSAATVRSGSVQLTDQTDSTLSRRGTIGADGSFTLPYVPPGTYTLQITASSQSGGNGRGGGTSGNGDATRFQPLQESVTVADSDLTGLSINVTPATTASQ